MPEKSIFEKKVHLISDNPLSELSLGFIGRSSMGDVSLILSDVRSPEHTGAVNVNLLAIFSGYGFGHNKPHKLASTINTAFDDKALQRLSNRAEKEYESAIVELRKSGWSEVAAPLTPIREDRPAFIADEHGQPNALGLVSGQNERGEYIAISGEEFLFGKKTGPVFFYADGQPEAYRFLKKVLQTAREEQRTFVKAGFERMRHNLAYEWGDTQESKPGLARLDGIIAGLDSPVTEHAGDAKASAGKSRNNTFFHNR